LLKDLRQKLGMALVLITHNPSLLVDLVDRVLVMYGGQVVEEGRLDEVFTSPMHPYTQGLLHSRPGNNQMNSSNRTFLPSVRNPASNDQTIIHNGCFYAGRCGKKLGHCASVMPEEKNVEGARRVRCFLYER
jgi:oligopeptide/dipeptide ABC transporter ATP-binding protein